MTLSSCGSNPKPARYTVDLGQQLIDLDRAHSDGPIREREYKRLKQA